MSSVVYVAKNSEVTSNKFLQIQMKASMRVFMHNRDQLFFADNLGKIVRMQEDNFNSIVETIATRDARGLQILSAKQKYERKREVIEKISSLLKITITKAD